MERTGMRWKVPGAQAMLDLVVQDPFAGRDNVVRIEHNSPLEYWTTFSFTIGNFVNSGRLTGLTGAA